ncbi:ubiquitin carboxyl-terminal hydrolase 21-like isoform X2 [Magnolia sinica]|uniref:ubiquitin carboxyl-terminal hydrolase 21-like isoform X2 n=1 Tax=Magnolia sinica TaxID=86752 RepID=UPI00265B6728|nr:ubiquitin carboxyl-terminal hydrolase 21-like isoform X2 [Magnolia sinica]
MVFIEALDNPSSPFFTEIKPFLVAAGLANIGNTCFLNAVLQCFTHTVQLVQSLRSFDHEFPCQGNDGGFCVLCALREHIDLSLASSGQTIIPWKLVENLNYLSSSLQRYRQEDAHEFFQCMLDRLHSCCVDLKPQDESSSLQDDSFINQIFGGRLRSQLRCCNCGHCSDNFEPLIDLSLEIEDTDSVLTALESFTQVEKIEDTETIFTCESCREEVSLEKQLKLDKVPEVVTLHLKRFKSNGYYIQKIWEFVGYPLELDLQPFVSSSNDDDNSKYELYAVLVHSGISSYSGHYFCFICSSPHSWYQLDDSEVTRVSEEDVLHQEAYILFYKRQGSPWFSSLMEAQQMLNDSDSLSTSPDSGIGDLVALAGMVDCSASHREFDEVTDAPSTQPSSSSSARILPEENSDVNDQIPCDQLRSVGKESLKKSSDEDGIDQLEMAGEEGLKKSSHDNGMVSKAVLRLLRGSMPDSRISQIMGCMAPSLECIDGSLKRQKMSDA